MRQVITEIHRVLKDRRYMGLYVSDSFTKKKGSGQQALGGFMPIGFELFAMMRELFVPVDIIAVVRHNQKLQRGNWHKAAEEGNFFLRGFNYLFIMKKEEATTRSGRTPAAVKVTEHPETLNPKNDASRSASPHNQSTTYFQPKPQQEHRSTKKRPRLDSNQQPPI